MTREEKVIHLIELIKSMTDEEVEAAVSTILPAREEKKYMKVQEMANTLGIGINQAYALCHREDFYPAVRVSQRRYLISASLLDQWMAQGHNSTS